MKNIKKYSALGILPILALTSCANDNMKEVEINDSLDNLLEDESSNINDDFDTLVGDTDNEEQGEEVDLSEGIIEEEIDTEHVGDVKDFSISYMTPDGNTQNYKGKIYIENGIVVSVEQVGNWSARQQDFFEGNRENMIGKNIEEIEVDTTSGASLVTESFRGYLNSIR